MNKTAIKNFAVAARVMLINAVTQVAFEYDVTEDGKNDPAQESVNGRTLTGTERHQRSQLIANIRANGFAQTMEEAAYTWFNRFIALRFMEVNNYLPSHTRIFSDEDGNFKPEVLSDAVNLDLDGLDKELVLELLENQENERLYKYIIITQCNSLNSGLPEMFEQIGGWTELLFPDHLLRSDSVIARMVEEIPEADWREQVQIIGWLYQYYNTEPKDKVFADLKKNIKISAENIPAATQLFTPDWIVRYMVENSLGRLWTEGHGKPENADWKYYLDEAEQEESVKAELAKIREGYQNIQPEQIKVIDPCMGSGHILVYAFDVLMDIYTSCGWSERDAAKSILRNNLYGLDIDRRAYQLAYFAVMMKARQYNRRIFSPENQPNLANFADVMGADTSMLSGSIKRFAEQFEFADIYGSLMTVTAPADIDNALSDFTPTFGLSMRQLEMMMKLYKLLGQNYDVVCTNPPYMGGSGMSAQLSDFVKKHFPDSKSDLFACFIEKCGQFAKAHGYYAMITQHAWMFLSSYENLRKKLMSKTTVNMAHLGARAFDEIGGEVVQTTAFVHYNSRIGDFSGKYARLVDIVGENEKRELFLSEEKRYTAKQENFSKIPGMPVAYWVSENFVRAFERGISIDSISDFTGSQHITANNDKYLRFFWEINFGEIGKGNKWVYYAKGGEFRRWYGNIELIVDVSPNAVNYYKTNNTSNMLNERYWFAEGITYSAITSKGTGFRYYPAIGGFDKGGATICYIKNMKYILALLNSNIARYIFQITNPTINLQVKDVKALPVLFNEHIKDTIENIVEENINISKSDWDSFETSWNFKRHPLV